MRSCTVYGLASSENGKIRYVGQTVATLRQRRYQHIWRAKRGGKTRISKWIRSVLRSGHDIRIFPIETNAVLHHAEQRLIAWYRRSGANLTNLTDGGEGTIGWRGNLGNKRPDLVARNTARRGMSGYPVSKEARAKISAANKGRKKPFLSERNRRNKGKPGYPHTPETRAKIGRAHKGKTLSAETRAKISMARRASKNEHCDAA